jgi:hypothetical protein
VTPDLSYRSVLSGLTWPGFPAPGAANKLALLVQIEQNQWRTPQQIEAAQFDQVRRLLAFAAETVPHYRQVLGGHFPAADINPLSWRDIPVLTRKALHALPAAIRSEQIPNGHGKNFPVSTSGSTGMVVELLGTELTNVFWQVFCLRDHLWHRRDLRQTLCTIRYHRDPAAKGPAGVPAAGWGPATDDIAEPPERRPRARAALPGPCHPAAGAEGGAYDRRNSGRLAARSLPRSLGRARRRHVHLPGGRLSRPAMPGSPALPCAGGKRPARGRR